MKRKYVLQSKEIDLDEVSDQVGKLMGIEKEAVWAAGKHRQTMRARSLLCFWAVRELGLSMTSMARKLKISVPAVCKSVVRGETPAKEKKYTLEVSTVPKVPVPKVPGRRRIHEFFNLGIRAFFSSS